MKHPNLPRKTQIMNGQKNIQIKDECVAKDAARSRGETNDVNSSDSDIEENKFKNLQNEPKNESAYERHEPSFSYQDQEDVVPTQTVQPNAFKRYLTDLMPNAMHTLNYPRRELFKQESAIGSVKLQNIFYKITNNDEKANNDHLKQQYRLIAHEQKSSILNSFAQQFPEIITYLKVEQTNNSFAIFWSLLLMVVFCYNYFTFLWLIGFPGFPEGFWYCLEVAAEVIAMIDFLARFMFPRFFPEAWRIMFLLHDRDDDKILNTIRRALASLPLSLIFSGVLSPVQLKSFWVACFRILKIARYRNFKSYFEVDQTNAKARYIAVFDILVQSLMGLHFVSIVFVLPERFQDGYGWFAAANYYNYTVPNWIKYIDSMVYCVSNMSGMGYGNIVPLTNGEWISACIIFTVGCSIYYQYCSDLTVTVSSDNQMYMDNHQEFEKCKNLAKLRHLPSKLRKKIRYYFKNLRIPFEEFKERNKLVNELPVSLKEEISLVVNQKLIHGVKFFQFCSPDFIMKICRFLKPHISIVNEHVFHKDSAAHRLYFINEGVCEVVANDEITPLRFLSKGSFFGEIGVLLTNKRSCSVIVRTTSILHAIKKEPLISILEEFPTQLKYLRAVGRQRLEKTSASNINATDASLQEQIQEQLKLLDTDQTVFGESRTESEDHSTLPLLKDEFLQNMRQLGRVPESSLYRSIGLNDRQQWTQQEHYSVLNFKDSSSPILAATPKFWQTKDMAPDYFLIIPFSPLFIIWNAILTIVVIYDAFMVGFSFGFGFKIEGKFMTIDIVCYCLLAIDMFIRSKTAITTPKKFCFNPKKVFNYYVNTWLLLDIISTFPLCYFLMISPKIDVKYLSWVRLLRLLKIFRFIETVEIFKWNSDYRVEIFTIFNLFLLYGFTGHVLAVLWAVVGASDYKNPQRFDSMTMFKFTETRTWQKGILDDISKLTPWQLYQVMIYFGLGVCGACPYGDMAPYSTGENIISILGQLWVRIMWALIMAEIVSFVGSMHNAMANHTYRKTNVLRWMRQQHIQSKLQKRYIEFQDCMWENFQGIEEDEILKKLPKSLQLEIKSHLFKNLIENWDVFPTENQGAIETVIRILKLVVYPQNEYIVTAGEIATEMFFIVQGVVEIRSQNNEVLNTLKQGQHFGEMALLDENNPIRMAHAVSMTMVSLAVLTKADFKNICEYFPSFKTKINLLVQVRKQMNDRIIREKALKESAESNKAVLAVIQEHEEQDNSQSILTDQHVDEKVSLKAQKGVHFDESFNSQAALRPKEKESVLPPVHTAHEAKELVTTINIPVDLMAISNLESEQKPGPAPEPVAIEIELNTHANAEAQQSNNTLNQFSDSDDSPNENIPNQSKIVRRDTIFAHFQLVEEKLAPSKDDKLEQALKVLNVINTVLVFYNLVWVPLQFGFRVPYTGIFLALEIFTILLYLMEVALRIKFVKRLKAIQSTSLALIKSDQERKLFANKFQLYQKLKANKIEIVMTLIALFPCGLIIAETNSYEPIGWMMLLQSLRLVKWRPVLKFWRWTKLYGFNVYTLLEVTFYYYIIAHWLSGCTLAIAIFKEDHRDSWLRRVPCPKYYYDIRPTKNVFDDVTKLELYNYAMYFQVNTLSNLTVGDITPITFTEKFVAGFNVWVGMFIYNLCFANVATVITYLVSGSHIEFFSRYNTILSKIRNGKVSENIINSVREFFNYIWYRHRGIDFEQLRRQLPASLSSDLCLTIYHRAIEQSMIFCNQQGDIDIPLAVSILKHVEFKQFLPSDFLIKVGQLTTETYILLEGELRVYGLSNDELLGILTKGSHIGLDLSDSFQDREDISKFDKRLKTGFKMDFESDNFDNRSIINLVANSVVTVGIIKETDREVLYNAFPLFKERMQYMNRILFQLGKVSLENHTKQNKFENTKYYCKNLQLDNIMYCTKDTYSNIIDKNLDCPNNQFDLSLFIKNCLMQRPDYVALKNLELYKPRLLVSDSQKWLNYDSKGNLVSKRPSILVVDHDSNFTKLTKLIYFFNILYIAFLTPFSISFDAKMGPRLISTEIISLMISLMTVITKLRTPVMIEGRQTLRLKHVLYHYRQEGLIVDLFGLIPLNPLLGSLVPFSEIKKLRYCALIGFLRFLRVINIWKGFTLIQEFTIYLKTASYYIVLVKAIVIWFVQGHLMGCFWYFVVNVMERDKPLTWKIQQNMQGLGFAEAYLRVYYFTLNIGTGIGSGDMVPQTELERLWISLFRSSGDVLWVFGFGLIMYFWTLERTMDTKKEIRHKIRQLQKLMDSYSIATPQRHMMEKFFAYQFYQEQHSKIMDKEELLVHLPISVVQEIVVQTNEQIFQVIFKNLKSENLIRELCLALKGQIYLPNDIIFSKGDQSQDIYFIVDGTIHLVANDMSTIAMTLKQGQYFGEIGVLSGERRKLYAKAATFCTLNSLNSEDLDQMSIIFPQLVDQLKEEASRKNQILERFVIYQRSPFMEEQNRIMEQFLDTSFVSGDQGEIKVGPLDSSSALGGFDSVIRQQLGAGNPVKGKISSERATQANQKRFRTSSMNNLTRNFTRRQDSKDEVRQRRISIASAGPSYEETPDNKKEAPISIGQLKRRLSEMSFGKLMPYDYHNLKLQWNVQGDNQNGWL